MDGHPQTSQPLVLRHHHTRIRPVFQPVDQNIAAKKLEVVDQIKETIIHEVTPPTPPPPIAKEYPPTPEAEKPKKEDEETTPPPPEEVKIWRIPLLKNEKSDVILLKILRPRDFKVKRSLFHAKKYDRLDWK
ncbi:patellin-3-like [Forsythia ovata]|uniref:Patellin-3-like n=1 Tax=Forsythia ovata TaxID=205694 RepID=A0ABD1WHA4_9LAMI